MRKIAEALAVATTGRPEDGMATKKLTTEPAVFDDGIVTAVHAYGDTDAIVRLFLKTQGKTSAFARSAKKSRKRFGSGLMPLAQGTIGLRPRRGAQLWALESISVTKDPLALAQDPVAFGRASYVVELLDRLLGEGDAAGEIFADSVTVLDEIGAGRGSTALLRAFELKLMGHTGYLPQLSLDAEVVAFDRETGRLLHHMEDGAIPFDAEAHEAAILLAGAALDVLPDIDPAALRRSGRLFAAHLRRQDVRPLKSVAFLKGLQ